MGKKTHNLSYRKIQKWTTRKWMNHMNFWAKTQTPEWVVARESDLKLDFIVSPQSSVDDSSYGYEKPDLSVIYRRLFMRPLTMQT